MDLKAIFKNGSLSFWKEIKSYLNVAGDLEPQIDMEQSIRAGVSFKGSQLLVLIFAIFIASLGLNTNSIPVIIGAMLISPLMGPIIGMGLGIGIQDFDLLKRGLKNIVAAMIGSLVASAIYFLISPQYEGASQLLARTSPSIYDVFVALFGGGRGHCEHSLQKQRAGDAWRSDRDIAYASPMHRGLRLSHMADELLFRSHVPFLHQHDLHPVRHLDRCKADGI